jgi:hypothetical protein
VEEHHFVVEEGAALGLEGMIELIRPDLESVIKHEECPEFFVIDVAGHRSAVRDKSFLKSD